MPHLDGGRGGGGRSNAKKASLGRIYGCCTSSVRGDWRERVRATTMKQPYAVSKLASGKPCASRSTMLFGKAGGLKKKKSHEEAVDGRVVYNGEELARCGTVTGEGVQQTARLVEKNKGLPSSPLSHSLRVTPCWLISLQRGSLSACS